MGAQESVRGSSQRARASKPRSWLRVSGKLPGVLRKESGKCKRVKNTELGVNVHMPGEDKQGGESRLLC